MKYKVGDAVRIRQWDDMASQYPVSLQNGRICAISTPGFWFHEGQKYLCGQQFTIRSIVKFADTHILSSEEGVEGCTMSYDGDHFVRKNWIITEEMVELCEGEEVVDIDLSELLSLFG